jgi:hypothetical protein
MSTPFQTQHVCARCGSPAVAGNVFCGTCGYQNGQQPPQYRPPQPDFRPKKLLSGQTRIVLAVVAGIVILIIVVVAAVSASNSTSPSAQANAVMQLDDSSMGTDPGSQAVQVINSAANEFNAVVVVTNDPSQADQDYATIGSDLGQVQQSIQDSDWTNYYSALGQVRSDIQSARADGTLTDPNG